MPPAAPRFLPRTGLARGAIAACVLGAVLLAAAALVSTGQTPLNAAATIGGPFTLVDQDGQPVTQATFAGHPFLVFFGYTHCPDVCPTTLAAMSQALQALGPSAMPALFVTVDPARDTAAVLKDYVSNFDPHIRGLTGSEAEVAGAEKAFKVYAKKVPGPNGDYVMDHTAVVYLMNPDGRFVAAVDLDRDPADVAATIKRDL